MIGLWDSLGGVGGGAPLYFLTTPLRHFTFSVGLRQQHMRQAVAVWFSDIFEEETDNVFLYGWLVGWWWSVFGCWFGVLFLHTCVLLPGHPTTPSPSPPHPTIPIQNSLEQQTDVFIFKSQL